MKSSQVLRLIGGIVGLGIVGVVATHLLTRDEDETEGLQAGGGGGGGFRQEERFGPVFLPVTLTTANGSDRVQNNQDLLLDVDTRGDDPEDVDFFVHGGTPDGIHVTLRRKHKKLKKEKIRVGGKHRVIVPINFPNVTSSEPMVIKVSAISDDNGGIYHDEINVILLP